MSAHLPGFQSPIFHLDERRCQAAAAATVRQLLDYVGRYDGKQIEHIRLQAPWWCQAIIVGGHDGRKADLLSLLSTAYASDGVEDHAVDVLDGVSRAATYAVGRWLSFNEVQALVLRNLSFIHGAQARKAVPLSYYYSQLGFLVFFLVLWDGLQSEEPDDRRYQFRLS